MINTIPKLIIMTGFFVVCLLCNTFGQPLFPMMDYSRKEMGSNRMGFVNQDGRVVINFDYYSAGEFSEGFARISFSKNGKEGFIDSKGKIAVQPKFDRAFPFYNGRAKVEIGNELRFITQDGDFLQTPQLLEARNFSEGLAPARIRGHGARDELWGYLSTDGCIAIQPRFQFAGDFRDGLAVVVTDGKLGYIDKAGKFVIPAKFDVPVPFTRSMHKFEFSNNLAPVFVNGFFAYANLGGSLLIPPLFEEVLPFSEGLAVVKIKGKVGFIDKTGKFAISANYEEAHSFRNGLAVVQKNKKWGIINILGKYILEPTYDYIFPFKNGLAQFSMENKIGYLNEKGEVLRIYR